MRLCHFDSTGVCVVCGSIKVNARQVCGPLPPGLGDILAQALKAIGVTKDMAQAVAHAVGLDDCGCEQRQQSLNDLGRRVGIGNPPPADSTPAAQ